MSSSACSAPSAAPDHLEISLAVEEGLQPSPHDLVVVDDEDADRVLRLSRHRDPIAIRRDLCANHGALAGRAVDRELHRRSRPRGCASSRARSGQGAGGRVEPEPVVADLDAGRGQAGPRCGSTPCGVRVLHGVGERLAADAEQLGRDLRDRAKLAVRGSHVDRQPVLRLDVRGVPRERDHESVLQRVAPQLGDQRSHLALRALREVRDRAQRLAERVRAHRRAPELLLSGTRLEVRGEERLGDRVVQIARDPVPLLDGPLVLAPLRLTSAAAERARSLTTAQRNSVVSGGHDDVNLCAERPVVDRLLEERPHLVGRDADRRAGHDRDRQRGARHPEAERRPDQCRENDICRRTGRW